MNTYNLTYKPFGPSAILIEWPARIEEAIIQDIIAFEKKVAKQQKVLDTIIAYNSLTIVYRHDHFYSLHYKYRKSYERTVEKLKALYEREKELTVTRQKIWTIPVCYDPLFGLDLKEIAQTNKLTVNEVITLHSQTPYLVYFIGFQPGFLYLGGLHEKLHKARKPNPRLRVEKGSVGIGGEQTGIYPQDSAGGWNLIGKSPINFFDVNKSQPCFAKAGDKIQFEPIDIQTYHEIAEFVQKRNYSPKFQWL